MTTLNEREKRQVQNFELWLKEQGILEEEDNISWVMEEASFNDTIGEIESIVDLSPHEQHTIQVNSINMYTAIDECRRGVMEELVKVNTKYKSVDKKVKPVVIPLPEDSWQRMKEVTKDPSLRDPKGIGHTFTDESRGKLQVGKDDFLLREEEERFRMMLERHGKSLRHVPTRR